MKQLFWIGAFLMMGITAIATNKAEAQPVVPLPIVTMTPSYYTQMAIFCTGGTLRMWQYEPGKGLIYCEEPTPIPTRPTLTPVPTKPQETPTPEEHKLNLPIVANGG